MESCYIPVLLWKRILVSWGHTYLEENALKEKQTIEFICLGSAVVRAFEYQDLVRGF